MTAEFGIGDLIGSGRVADVVAHNINVIKLYRQGLGKREVFREAAVLSALEETDLPIPTVYAVGQFGGRWGLEMSRAPDASTSLAGEALGVWMARLHWRLHQIRVNTLTSLKLKLARNIHNAVELETGDRTRLLSLLEDLPNDSCICHGDFHPANIMGSEAEPYIVDWLDATSGPAQADACRTYLLALHHAPEMARPYLVAYEQASGFSAEQILVWLPVVAAARLSEKVADEAPRLLAIATSSA